jgi:uncharacterized membrane protein
MNLAHHTSRVSAQSLNVVSIGFPLIALALGTWAISKRWNIGLLAFPLTLGWTQLASP